MSANLLAEFESFYQPGSATPGTTIDKTTQAPEEHSFASFGFTAHPNSRATTTEEEEEDEFGDFEVAQPSPRPPPKPVAATPRAAPLSPLSPSFNKALPPPPPLDDNVLFDAERDFQEDDFGEFTEAPRSPVAASPHIQRQIQPTSIHERLIDFDDVSSTPALQPAPKPLERKARQARPPPTLASQPRHAEVDLLSLDEAAIPVTLSRQPEANPKPVSTSQPIEDNDWDDFETSEPAASGSIVNMDLTLDPLILPALPANGELPPTNIPPPALLLSLFPAMANMAQSQLFDRLAHDTANTGLRDAVLQAPQTRPYLDSLLQVVTVLARVIAGRKQRWKRDNILAQSMRIGPASASGKSGGMKLAGIDRAENAREEREVSEAVRAWRAQLGRLKLAVNAAGKVGEVPEIAETYTVRLLAASEGAIITPKACVLCGLKRNERVAKVDFDVQDSFGEWWTEHWGHNSCARLWYAQKDSLKSR